MTPSFQPVVNVDADTLDEKHFRRVSVGEPIKTYHQAFSFMPPTGWHISSFFTSDRQVVTGRTTYRAPASVRAWLVVVPQVARKWWARLTQKTPSS